MMASGIPHNAGAAASVDISHVLRGTERSVDGTEFILVPREEKITVNKRMVVHRVTQEDLDDLAHVKRMCDTRHMLGTALTIISTLCTGGAAWVLSASSGYSVEYQLEAMVIAGLSVFVLGVLVIENVRSQDAKQIDTWYADRNIPRSAHIYNGPESLKYGGNVISL